MPQDVALQAINNRVWYVKGGVHPTRSPQYLSLGKFSGDPTKSMGEKTKIGAPDPNSFNRDVQVGSVRGSIDRATFSIATRYTVQKAVLLELANAGCRVDWFTLSGKCGNPQDFTEGGEKWMYFPDGDLSTHSLENYGAFSNDENNPTNEMVDATSETYYEFLYMRQEQVGAAYTTREIYTVDVYVGNECENCPDPCDRVLASMAGASATPGTKPSLLYSGDGGVTFSTQDITTMFSNEVVSDGDVLTGDMVLISNTSNSIHWTDLEMLYSGSNTWQEVTSGFVAAKNPNAMFTLDSRHIWIVGNGGYIYFSSNHKVGVSVQDAGVATTQHLQAVHAFDQDNVLVVGNANAVVYSRNGGVTWATATGPAVGLNLGACWMWDRDVWFVGEGSGGSGKLWLTVNAGLSWTEISLPVTSNRVYKIVFISEAEGYIIVATGGQSVVLRTITAGSEWVALPQGKKGTAVANTYLRDLAVCSRYANTAFTAGLAANGTAGIILKMSA
jgi:photosystem II stability/assembly factor-like uncharacterized protein